MENLNSKIRALISSGNTEKALKILIKNIEKGQKNEFIILSNRFSEIKRRHRLGVISFQEEQIEINKINHSILEALDKIGNQKLPNNSGSPTNENRPKSNYAQIILAACAVITLFYSISSFFNFSNTENIPTLDSRTEKPIEKIKDNRISYPIERSKTTDTKSKPTKINFDKCVEELLTEHWFYSWFCVGKLIENKEFDTAVSIFEKAKSQTINPKKLKLFNSKINDIEIIIKLNLDDAQGENSDSLIAIKKNNKWGFSDKEGKIIYAPIFNSVNPQDFQPIIEFEEHGKIGFINNSGKIIHLPRFNSASPMEFYPLIVVEQNELIGFMDSLGKILFEPVFQDAIYQKEDMIGVKKNDKWGFIDIEGKVVIDFKYNSVAYFENGIAKVRLNDIEFFIDKKGNKLSY